MIVLLDSNAVFADPVMVRDAAQKTFKALGPAQATLVFSPVVIAELNRQRDDEMKDLASTILSRLKTLGSRAGVDVKSLNASVVDAAVEAHERWSTRWNEILNHPRVEVADWPATSAKELVARELGRRRPFVDKEPGTIGHRDTVIWLTVLELLDMADHAETLVLVTSDSGFLTKKGGLHPDLIEDLAQRGVDPDRVLHVPSLTALLVVLAGEAEGTDWDAWREPAIAEVIVEALADLSADDFTGSWNPGEDGLDDPPFDLGIPQVNADWSLDDIDGPYDLDVGASGYGVSQVGCSFVVEIGLSGFMDKSDWYSDEHKEVELWDSNWNDHVVMVHASPTVKFTAMVEVDDDSQEATFVKFVGAALKAEPGLVELG